MKLIKKYEKYDSLNYTIWNEEIQLKTDKQILTDK